MSGKLRVQSDWVAWQQPKSWKQFSIRDSRLGQPSLVRSFSAWWFYLCLLLACRNSITNHCPNVNSSMHFFPPEVSNCKTTHHLFIQDFQSISCTLSMQIVAFGFSKTGMHNPPTPPHPIFISEVSDQRWLQCDNMINCMKSFACKSFADFATKQSCRLRFSPFYLSIHAIIFNFQCSLTLM